jgi:hypothetical protein
MFHPDKEFRLILLETLGEEGKSISALSKALNDRGVKVNRIMLAGYLRALTDMRIVREKEVPPSKIFIPIKGEAPDIYSTIGEMARRMHPEREAFADELILLCLCRVFHRAVFQQELERAGVKGVSPGRVATSEERNESRRVLQKAGITRIPDSQKAYVSDRNDLQVEASVLLEDMLVEFMGVGYLVRETTQTKLTL